jgi:hypothetical protein
MQIFNIISSAKANFLSFRGFYTGTRKLISNQNKASKWRRSINGLGGTKSFLTTYA